MQLYDSYVWMFYMFLKAAVFANTEGGKHYWNAPITSWTMIQAFIGATCPWFVAWYLYMSSRIRHCLFLRPSYQISPTNHRPPKKNAANIFPRKRRAKRRRSIVDRCVRYTRPVRDSVATEIEGTTQDKTGIE